MLAAMCIAELRSLRDPEQTCTMLRATEAEGNSPCVPPAMKDVVPKTFPMPPEMRGEAAPGAYEVRTGDGDPADASHAIFPIVKYDPDSRPHLIGTGFFVSNMGLFVTARHVLLAAFDEHGHQRDPIGIIQFLPNGTYLRRPILRCTTHRIADVAVGVAAPMSNNKDGTPLTNRVLTLTVDPPNIGTRVVTFAYPKHINLIGDVQILSFAPTWFDGKIEEHLTAGRDRVVLPGPCYQTSIVIHGGASGGPVFCPSGCVFGVNSTGFDGTDISYVSRVNETLTLTVEGVSMGGDLPRMTSAMEMVREGHLLVKPSPHDMEGDG